MDLSTLAYRDLDRWCRDAAGQLEVPKVTSAAVMRTLLALLDEDRGLAEQVRTRIAPDPWFRINAVVQ